jgi:uncharacterized protein YegJ (DUF2314 family)
MVKLLQLKSFLIVCVLFGASCTPPAPTPTSTFTDPDAEFQEAVRKAQGTLHILRQGLLAPKPSYAFLSLKVRFESEDGTEDMWTEAVFFMGDTYTVRMVEGVTLETGAHPDRLVEVQSEEVLDWMIKEDDGTVIGGYTLRLEYERMSPEQQKRFHEVTGYKFD